MANVNLVHEIEQGTYTKEFYSIIEVSRMFSVDYQTIRRMCLDGRLKSIRLGRSWRIPCDEVAKMATQGKKGHYVVG